MTNPTFRMSRNLLTLGIIIALIAAWPISTFTVGLFSPHISSIAIGWAIISLLIITKLYFDYKFTVIETTEKGLMYRKGWMNTSERRIPYANINTIDLRRSIIARLFGFGNIDVYTGNDKTKIMLQGFDQPERLKELIESKIG